MDTKNWLDQATEKILFDPDREAVRRELEDHLQDRQERYTAKGLSPEEAEAAALADMGDPADIAEELGKLHRPFWGYLWTLSKLLLGFAFLLAIVRVFVCWDNILVSLEQTKAMHLHSSYSEELSVVSEQRLHGSVAAGNYTVSVSTALLELTEGREQFLCLYLRFLPHIPWEPVSRYALWEGVYPGGFTDDSGVLYTMDNGRIKNIGRRQNGPTVYLELMIQLEDGQSPKWVDVPLGKSDYTLRVDLEEGVSLK